MSASSRLHLNIDQDRNDETRDVENFEDGDFPALTHNYDRRAHTHHSRPKETNTKKTNSLARELDHYAACYFAYPLWCGGSYISGRGDNRKDPKRDPFYLFRLCGDLLLLKT